MRRKLTVFHFILWSTIAAAQADSTSSTVYQPAVEHALSVYEKFRGETLNLFKGVAQEQLKLTGIATPFFGNGGFTTGSVLYEGVQYDDVMLQYNLVRDELVVQNTATRNAFYLFKPRVEWFTLGNRTFINLQNAGTELSLPDGYYEQLTTGRLTLLEKHEKTYQESFRNNSIEQRFDETSRFFAVKDGRSYKISNAKSLYALTGDLKNEIRDQVKRQKAAIGSDLKATLVAIARSFNQSNQ